VKISLLGLKVLFCFVVTVFTQDAMKSFEIISKDGLTVEKLVEIAKSERADLQAAKQRLKIAQGKLQQASLLPNPTIDIEYASPRFLGEKPETDFSVKLSQNFELGGKRQKRKLIAELELQQTKAELAALEKQIEIEIISAYTNAIALSRQLNTLQRLISADQEIIKATEARVSEGDVAPLDLNLIKVEIERLKIQAVQTKAELETQILDLKLKVGIPIEEQLSLSPQDEKPMLVDFTLSELIETALRERPDLQAVKLSKEIAEARLNLAKSGLIPDLTTSIGFSQTKQIFEFPLMSPQNPTSFIKREKALGFGVSLNLPIFNRNQGEIAVATAEKMQATKTLEFLENKIKADVTNAYRKYRAAIETLVIYSTQILPRAEANLQSVNAAYGFGEFSVFELINEQRRLIENSNGYNQALRDYYVALAQLEAAVGKKLSKSSFASPINSSAQQTQIDKEKLSQSVQKFSKEKQK
jgi:cobalt-zinc-cadmium efflux system outer membrane protein